MPARSAACKPSSCHARFHARRHVARAGGIRRHRQAANGRLPRSMPGRRAAQLPSHLQPRRLPFDCGAGVSKPRRGRVFLRSLPDSPAPRRRHSFVRFARATCPLVPRHGDGDIHGRFVGLDFEMSWSASTVSPGLTSKLMMVGLGDGFAELRHDDGNRGHDVIDFATRFRARRRAMLRAVGRCSRPEIRMIRHGVSFAFSRCGGASSKPNPSRRHPRDHFRGDAAPGPGFADAQQTSGARHRGHDGVGIERLDGAQIDDFDFRAFRRAVPPRPPSASCTIAL